MAGRKKQPPAALRNVIVDAYAGRLKVAGLDRPAFESVVAELAKDKAARTAELSAIASNYVGVPLASRTKKAALQVIEKRFVERVRSERKREIASKITPA